jgi:tRNA(Ile)-lysidine synthase
MAYQQLRYKIYAVHVHHGISPNADHWALHCEQYARSLQVPFVLRHVQIESSANLEEEARTARYQVFESLLQATDALVLAHHQTDQSETLLLNIMRGAGVEGLSAMPAQRSCGRGMLLRPLLAYARERLLAYATLHQLRWIEDESNASEQWSRSYLRLRIMPLLRAKWPAADAMMAASASHCRQASQNLNALAMLDCDDLSATRLPLGSASLLDSDRLHNLLRAWIKYHTGKAPSSAILACVINEVIQAKVDAMPIVHVGTWTIRRYQQALYLVSTQDEPVYPCAWTSFPEPLVLSEAHTISVIRQSRGITISDGARVEIRGRTGGESIFWRGQTRRLKTLLQEWGVPPWQRKHIPLVYVNDKLIAIIGYAHMDSDADEGYIFRIN